jgi:hypothetical protein
VSAARTCKINNTGHEIMPLSWRINCLNLRQSWPLGHRREASRRDSLRAKDLQQVRNRTHIN